MMRNLLLLAHGLILSFQFALMLISGLVEHHPPPSAHTLLGVLLIASISLHLYLNRGWVKVAFTRYGSLPKPAQTNVLLNLLLFAAFLNCGITGLIAALVPFHLMSHFHLLSVPPAAIILTIHTFRHLKWAQHVLQSMFARILPTS